MGLAATREELDLWTLQSPRPGEHSDATAERAANRTRRARRARTARIGMASARSVPLARLQMTVLRSHSGESSPCGRGAADTHRSVPAGHRRSLRLPSF